MKGRTNLGEILIILIGEIIVGALTAGVYLIVEAALENDAFTYKVITGLALGTTVVIVNYLVLTVVVNRAINKVMALRPEGEMTEDEIFEFAKANQDTIKNAAAFSYIVRTLTMLATLVLVFIFLKKWFAVVATVVPLLAFRPIIMVGEFFRKRWCK